YVPILNDTEVKPVKQQSSDEGGGKGAFYIIKPGDKDCEVLSKVTLDGRCSGSPAVYNGKVYVQTSKKLFCFGRKGNNPGLSAPMVEEKWPAPGPAKQLQVIPSEVLLHPGQAASFRLRSL